MFYVYLLQCDNNTYIGATVNLERRLRQHNKEIKGGAKITTSKIKDGKLWNRLLYISGFPSWNTALQFEWKWKSLSKKYKLLPLENRLYSLIELLGLERPTKKSISFSEWIPVINFEDNNINELFLTLID